MSYLQGLGFEVETVFVASLDTFKTAKGIPQELWSCHTVLFEDAGYWVEGHMPVAMVEKLLEEQPDIDGISLPGMPAGTPGMPGEQTQTLEVYAVKDGSVSLYATFEPAE